VLQEHGGIITILSDRDYMQNLWNGLGLIREMRNEEISRLGN